MTTYQIETTHDLTTLQGIFDHVVEALAAQGVKAQRVVGDRSTCQLRGAGGTKCAVGHLIPDAAYQESFEALGSLMDMPGVKTNPIIAALDARIERSPQMRRFLIRLQEAHDENYTGEWLPCWRAKMRKIAKAYNLSTEVCDRLAVPA